MSGTGDAGMSTDGGRRMARGNLAAASVGFASALILVAALQARPSGDDGSSNVAASVATAEATLTDLTTIEAADDRMSGDGAESMQPAGPTTDADGSIRSQSEMTAVPRRVGDQADVAVVNVAVDVPEAPSAPRCQALAEEIWRREDSGEFVYEEYVELTEEEYHNAPLNLSVPRTDMAAVGERPSFAGFGESYDVADIPNQRLDEVVGRCWELGLLD